MLFRPPCVWTFAGALLLASRPGDTPEHLRDRALEAALARAEAALVVAKDLVVDHTTWADPWIVRSQNYEVRTTQSHFVAAKIGRDLDFMLGEYGKLLDLEDYSPRENFQVWIFPRIGDYNSASQNAAEHSSFYGSFYASNDPDRQVSTYYDPNPTRLGMHVTHSACHQFVEQAFAAQLPVWVSEGIASYFTLFWDWNWGNQRFRSLAAGREWIPVENLVRASLADYLPRDQRPIGEHRIIELGMLFQYLLHHKPETRIPAPDEPEPEASFREYLRAVVRGQDASQTGFMRMLEGAGGFSSLEEEVRAFDLGG